VIDELLVFLRARLAEDEQVAQAAAEETDPSWDDNGPYGETVTAANAGGFVACGAWGGDVPWEVRQHVARHDPARALAEVDAKRRIVQMHAHALAMTPPERVALAILTLRALARPYADHPDYRPEWAPEG
jgi:hypothetical protein